MLYINTLILLIILFISSCVGYIFCVLIEKKNLKSNLIVIDNENVTQEDINEANIKRFVLGKKEYGAGDEIKVKTAKNVVKGILLGAKKEDNSLILITDSSGIESVKITDIKWIRTINRYGKFF